MKFVRSLDLTADWDGDPPVGAIAEYVVARPIPEKKALAATPEWPVLKVHCDGVKEHARAICSRLGLPKELARLVELAAGWHDLGKGHRVWQRGAGNTPTAKPVSKPIHGRPPENLNHFRHELGSAIDICGDPILASELERLANAQDEWARELTLHLIAAHHGRARPHFPEREATDPERPAIASTSVTADTPGRFARLQRRFGRWGLAYLESLVRAADALDSQRIEETPLGDAEPGQWPAVAEGFTWSASQPTPEPSIRVAVAPTNPGQFFACCGLLELADRRWRGAEGWFQGQDFCISCAGTLRELISQISQAEIKSSMSSTQLQRLATLLSRAKAKLTPAELEEKEELREMWKFERVHISDPFDLWLDWWRDERGERTELKTWAAKQLVTEMAQEMLKIIRAASWSKMPDTANPFPMAHADALSFNFDSDLSGQGSARDAGFSFDTLGLKSAFRPLLELLAFIGLQRFRPSIATGDKRLQFSLWSMPLPLSVAAAAACGALALRDAQLYEFRLFNRTKYMKSYLPAQPCGGL